MLRQRLCSWCMQGASSRVIGGLRAATLVPETRPWGRKVNMFGDKEAGDELRFFRERDAETLRNLLKKKAGSMPVAEVVQTKDTHDRFTNEFERILEKYRVSSEDANTLLMWKENEVRTLKRLYEHSEDTP